MKLPTNYSNYDVYMAWREKKLDKYPTNIEDIIVKLANPGQPEKHKIQELLNICSKTNMVIYEAKEFIHENKQIPLDLGFSVGLKNIEYSLTTESDGVSELSVAETGIKRKYIPYTNRRLGWHTDGCYNDPKNPINGFILHCVRAAE